MEQEPNTTTRRSRKWIWFFALLVPLAVVAIAIPILFNRSQLLTREKLEAARARWKERGPQDYDLEYVKRGSVAGTYVVQVRAGKVVRAELDGRPLEPRLYLTCDVEALFDDIDRFLEIDAQPGSPRTFTVAQFDPADGHPLHYIRSVTATRQRIEITVQLRPPAASSTDGGVR